MTASQTDDSHMVVVGISDKYLTDLKVQKRWEHEHRSAASHFLNLASEERRQLSKQAVIPRTEPYNLDWSTLADAI